MDEFKHTARKRALNWIRITIIVILLFLCMILIIKLGSLIFQRNWFQKLLLSTTSAIATASPTPTETQFSLIIEPHNPTEGDYPFLTNLVGGWEGSSNPSTHIWDISVPSDQPVIVYLSWCTNTVVILDQNYQHLRWSLTIDGTDVSGEDLYLFRYSTMERSCQAFSGIIWDWTVGEHIIEQELQIDEPINDGWNQFVVGNYIDIFNISVSP